MISNTLNVGFHDVILSTLIDKLYRSLGNARHQMEACETTHGECFNMIVADEDGRVSWTVTPLNLQELMSAIGPYRISPDLTDRRRRRPANSEHTG
jgi:hypothetical protein